MTFVDYYVSDFYVSNVTFDFSICFLCMSAYKHPVLQALGTLDRSADNYQERRVKIINKVLLLFLVITPFSLAF